MLWRTNNKFSHGIPLYLTLYHKTIRLRIASHDAPSSSEASCDLGDDDLADTSQRSSVSPKPCATPTLVLPAPVLAGILGTPLLSGSVSIHEGTVDHDQSSSSRDVRRHRSFLLPRRAGQGR